MAGGMGGGMIGQTITTGLGGIMGTIGGALAGYRQEKLARKTQKSVRKGVAAGEAELMRKVGTIMSTPEFLTATNLVRGLYGIGGDPRADLFSTLHSTFGTQEIITNPHYQAAVPELDYRFGTGGQGQGSIFEMAAQNIPRYYGGLQSAAASSRAAIAQRNETPEQQEARAQAYQDVMQAYGEYAGSSPMDPLTADYIKGVRQAQSARGLYTSQVGAAAEASGLAAFRARLQLEQLPTLLMMAQAPAMLGEALSSGILSKRVFSETGGLAAYGQPTPYAYPGIGIGAGAMMGAVSGLAAGSGAGAGMSGGGGGGSYGMTAQQASSQAANKPVSYWV